MKLKDKNSRQKVRDTDIIQEKHEILKDGRLYTSESYIGVTGRTIVINIPDYTKEEKERRDRILERNLISIYQNNENTRKYLVNSIDD